MKSPNEILGHSWLIQAKDTKRALSDDSKTWIDEVSEELGGILNEAHPREIFKLLAKKYAKVFEGVNSDDDAAGWSSENEDSNLSIMRKADSEIDLDRLLC